MLLGRDSKVGVVGAGAMGTGIAQVAASAGHRVLLYDTSPAALERAITGIEKSLTRSVEKGRLAADQANDIRDRITLAGVDTADFTKLDEFHGSALVIEAVLEELDLKRDIFSRLEKAVGDDAVLVTNTSSLSVTAIARSCKHP